MRAARTAMHGIEQNLLMLRYGAGGGRMLRRGTAACGVRRAGGDKRHQKDEKRLICAPGDANVQPYAMVIKVTHASIAYAAVFRIEFHVASAGDEAEAVHATALHVPAPLAENFWLRSCCLLIVPKRVPNIRKRAIKPCTESDTEAALPQRSENNGGEFSVTHGPDDEPKRSVENADCNPACDLMRIVRCLAAMVPS